jgi:hypothetical protein
MPLLLEDLAEESSASNRRVAGRLEAEARELRELRRFAAELEELRQKCVESARQATAYVIARVPEAEAFWRSVLMALRMDPSREERAVIVGGSPAPSPRPS